VPDLKGGISLSDYNEFRNDIVQHCINGFEVCESEEFTSSLLFDILTQLTKKCYIMIDPETLFNEITSPFLFMPLLETTFLGGSHTERGADFLSMLFWNLYIAQPQEAILDVTERNFGFQITSVAGVNVEESGAKGNDEAEKKKVDGGEVGAMKQEETMR
jgi:hypothetical protein